MEAEAITTAAPETNSDFQDAVEGRQFMIELNDPMEFDGQQVLRVCCHSFTLKVGDADFEIPSSNIKSFEER